MKKYFFKRNFKWFCISCHYVYLHQYEILTGARNKKISLWFLKQSHFCVNRLEPSGIQLIKEYKSIVNGLKQLKQFKKSGKTLYKLHLTKIFKIRLFDHHPITSKLGRKTRDENLHNVACKVLEQN